MSIRAFVVSAMMTTALIVGATTIVNGELQPTFGRPKSDKTKPDPSTPKTVPEPSPAGVPREAGDSDHPSVAPTKVVLMEDWREGDPERRAPSSDAEPGKVYCWKTTGSAANAEASGAIEGVRYAWSLPVKVDLNRGHNLIVLLHPAGLDFRWGVLNFPRERSERCFRPGDIVVSMDGPVGDPRRPSLRYFEPTQRFAIQFRDVMLELARTFPVRRIYICGQGGLDNRASGMVDREQAEADPDADDEKPGEGPVVLSGGGAFATAFAGAFPALADGVVSHGAGMIENTAANTSVPLVFMHGAKDGMLPLHASLEAAGAFRDAGHTGVRVRVLREFNDFPNAVRMSEAIDYLEGTRTTDAQDALSAARSMLAPKPIDELGYTCPVWFGGAYEVLARFEATRSSADDDDSQRTRSSTPVLEEITDAQRRDAARLRSAIDAEAKAHAEALTRLLKTDDLRSLPLDGGAWLGYLVAFREDFRGVPNAEHFAQSIGYDSLAIEHARVARPLIDQWKAPASVLTPAERYTSWIENLPKCFLYEGLPVELTLVLKASVRKGDELGLTREDREGFEWVTLWERGWREGLKAYAMRWSRWSLPEEQKTSDEQAEEAGR